MLIDDHGPYRSRNCMDLRGARENSHSVSTILRQRCRRLISLLPLHFCPPQPLNSRWPNRNRIPLLKCAVNYLLLISTFQILRQMTMFFMIFPFQRSTRVFLSRFQKPAILVALPMTCSSALNRRNTSVFRRNKLDISWLRLLRPYSI